MSFVKPGRPWAYLYLSDFQGWIIGLPQTEAAIRDIRMATTDRDTLIDVPGLFCRTWGTDKTRQIFIHESLIE